MTSTGMDMNESSASSIYSAAPAKLAKLIDSIYASGRVWRSEELGEVLRHQLEAPLELEGPSPSDLSAAAKPGEDSASSEIRTLADIFQHPDPPLKLLDLAKEFAKSNRERPDSPLPPEVATVIYFAAIAAALVRCGSRITALDDKSIRAGLEWVRAQSWIDPQTRELCSEARRFVGT